MKRLSIALCALCMLAAVGLSASAAVVKGVVIGKGDKPVPNALIVVIGFGEQHGEAGFPMQKLKSDAKGQFQFTPVSANSFVLITADGYSFSNAVVPESRAANPVSVRLWPERKLKGKVVDESGKPVQGARVVVSSLQGNTADGKTSVTLPDFSFSGPTRGKLPDTGIPKVEAVTDANGAFTLSRIPDPDGLAYVSVQLTFSRPGRASVTKSLYSSELSRDLAIVQPRACRIFGTVYLPGKTSPAPEGTVLSVVARSNDGMEMQFRPATVGKGGQFEFAGLPPGDVTLVMNSQQQLVGGAKVDRYWALRAVTGIKLGPAESKRFELVGVNGVLVRGTVTDKSTGKPAQNAQLTVLDSSRSRYGGDTIQGNDKGEYEFISPAGQVTVRVAGFSSGDRFVYYQGNEAPAASISVTEDTPAVLDLVADPSAAAQPEDRYAKSAKPAIDGLELTPGTYPLAWDSSVPCDTGAITSGRYSTEETMKRIKTLPKLISQKPSAVSFPLDGVGDEGLLYVVMDESQGTGKGFDTAYIDANRNGDLSDDKPVSWTYEGPNSYTRLPSVDVTAHHAGSDGRSIETPMQVSLEVGSSAYMQASGGWHGKVETNKGKIDFALIDINSNGVYNDHVKVVDASISSIGDVAYADINGAGCLAIVGGSTQRIPLNGAALVAGKLYTIEPSAAGDSVTIQRYAGPSGTLQVKVEKLGGLSGTVQQMVATGPLGYYQVSNGAAPIALPVGKYSVSYCQLHLNSKQRPDMTLTLQMDAKTEVKSGELSTFAIGGKMIAAISPDQKELTLKVNSNERISWVVKIGDLVASLQPGGQGMQSDTVVEFFDAANKLVYTTNAGYT